MPDSIVSNSPVRANVHLVTPEMAADILSRNRVNRPLRVMRIAFFSDLVTNDQFVMTGEPVQVEGYLTDPEFGLLNGQHRLHGIVRANKPAQLLIVEGIERSTRMFMDTGAKRTFADALRMEREVSNAAAHASAVRLGYTLETQGATAVLTGGSRIPQSNAELLAWYDAHPELSEALPVARRVRDEIGASEPAMAYACMMLSEIDAKECEDFFERLTRGDALIEGDPVLILRRYMLNARAKRPRPRAVMQLAVSFKAWNVRRAGETIKNLRWAPYGTYQEEFPTPI